jgi:hypothetical protein
MHFFIRLGLLFTALALPALAETTPVRVLIPVGLRAGDVSTSDSPKTGFKYVTIDSVQVVNPSRSSGQSFEPKDFHLLVDDSTYFPSVRPGLGALDLRQPGIVGPGQGLRITVSFLVPASVTSAKFEFTPHWMSDAGFSVDWCCEYL